MHATHLGSLGVTVYASVLIRRRGHSGKGRILIRQTIRVWHYHLATKLRRKAIKKRPKKKPPNIAQREEEKIVLLWLGFTCNGYIFGVEGKDRIGGT